MRLLHAKSRTSAAFDDPNLVSAAGLVPAVRLAEDCGLSELVGQRVKLAARVGVNAAMKITCLVFGMLAGADSIEDMGLVRHGALPRTFGGLRAPSTLGSFLRGFGHGNVAQLAAVHRALLARLAIRAGLLPDADQLAFVDIDSVQRPVFGPAKQGAAFGHAKIANRSLLVRGLNALVATVSTPAGAPLVCAARLRGGNAASARGAASLIVEAIRTARAAGASGLLIVRADSAYYSAAFVAACRRAGTRFSVTARMDTAIRAAIATIAEDAWTPIKYPNAIFDEDSGQWISDAEIAEVRYTAFRSKRKAEQIEARLIVRRVRRLGQRPAGQGELFATWRYHAVFTDSPMVLVQAEAQHRGHAVIEQTFADLIDGPLAHLPSGVFHANAAWLVLACITQNLTRALGTLAGGFHALARGATIRAQLINVAARPARRGRDEITWHLPRDWPWADAWLAAFDATHRPPQAA